jgi:outer membrane protein W
MKRSWIAALALSMIATAQQVSAQDAGRFGIVFAVPAALGIIWHATDNVALRPELNLSTTSAVSSSSTTTTIGNQAWQVAVSAPFYIAREDNVRAYLSPRVAYTHVSTDATIGGTTTHTGYTEMGYSGSVGVQYAPVRRFSIFGETGLAYTTSHNSDVGYSNKSHEWSLRSAVGVILYLGK